MSLSENMQKEFSKKMRTLEEDGLFKVMQRTVVPKTRFLIVSYGGTGADALFAVKAKLEKYLPAEQLQRYVKFLAIDTDLSTNEHRIPEKQPDGSTIMVTDAKLANDEFLWLDNTAARAAIRQSEQLEDWINPDLLEMIRANPTYLDGNGASGKRQLGRLTLFPRTTTQRMQTVINNLVTDLMCATTDQLRVMILTGISGGTGSGIVIDATYLIRHFISRIGNLEARTRYLGFILLPPTGKSNNPAHISHGNTNGYAALKEINQLMNTAARRDNYCQSFADFTIRTSKSIFDQCYLLDGNMTGVFRSNPRDLAKSVLSDCILDMITSQPTAGDSVPQTVDAFMSDVPIFSAEMLRTHDYTQAPRDADYLYSVLGHGNVSIPIDLMKAYVVKKVYDKMYSVFNRFANVTESDCKDFIRAVRVRHFTTRAQQNAIDTYINNVFKSLDNGKGGPFYVINLLRDTITVIEDEKHKFIKIAPENQLECMSQYMLKLNQDTFSVFTAVLEEMKKIMEAYGVLTGGGYENDGYSYSFRPITLGAVEGQATVVTQYLDGLVDGSTTRKLTTKLLETMIENKDSWTQLIKADNTTGSFDAATEIRKFWTEEIAKIVDSTLEDFLIKFYTGDKNAHYVEGDQASEDALNIAANAMYNQMFGGAGNAHPLAEMEVQTGLTMTAFNGHNMMLVPKQAKHLIGALKQIAAAQASQANTSKVEVYESEAADCISCYCHYTAVPAFKLKWVARAEPDYERSLATVGLHMSETEGGKHWRDFPSLLPESTWQATGVYRYSNPREKKLADRAQDLFKRAEALGLVHGTPSQTGTALEFKMRLLPTTYHVGGKLFEEYDTQSANDASSDGAKIAWDYVDATADVLARKLFASVEEWDNISLMNICESLPDVAFMEFRLGSPDTVLARYYSPDNWDRYIAACMLRKSPVEMAAARSTVLVMEKLRALVEEYQNRKPSV